MRLHGRLNAIEHKVTAMKDFQDSTVLVATGVWFADENGDIIPDSGPVSRVPREDQERYGILLVPEPVKKEGFAERVKECELFQKTLKNQIEDLS